MDVPQKNDEILYPLASVIETSKDLEAMIEKGSKPKHIQAKLSELNKRVERVNQSVNNRYKFK